MPNQKAVGRNATLRLVAVAFMLGCGEERAPTTTLEVVDCYLGWLGELPYEGPSLETQTCWNDKCSAMFETTVLPLVPDSPSEETTDPPDDGSITEDVFEPCERVPQTEETPTPCGGPGEQDQTGRLFPGGVGPGCGFDGQHSDFPVKACARTLPSPPGSPSTFVQVLIWPHPRMPGQGQDLLRDGDELSLYLEGAGGDVLADHTVTIDQYNVTRERNSSCKSAGFTLDGERL